MNTEFIPFVTGHYHWLIPPFLALYKKYFDVPFTFFTDRSINANHKILFRQDCKIYHEPVGTIVKEALAKVDKPLIAILLVDLLPTDYVNIEKFEILEKFMLDNQSVARGNLFNGGVDSQFVHQEKLATINEMDIVKVSPHDRHIGLFGSTALTPAIWNKKFLLEFIEDDWPLDKIEIPGHTKFSNQDKWFSIATIPSLLNVSHLCYTSKPNGVRLSEVKEQDKHFVEPFIPKDFEID